MDRTVDVSNWRSAILNPSSANYINYSQQLHFRHELNSAPSLDADDTKVQILAFTHNRLYTLRGTNRTRLLHPHASP